MKNKRPEDIIGLCCSNLEKMAKSWGFKPKIEVWFNAGGELILSWGQEELRIVTDADEKDESVIRDFILFIPNGVLYQEKEKDNILYWGIVQKIYMDLANPKSIIKAELRQCLKGLYASE